MGQRHVPGCDQGSKMKRVKSGFPIHKGIWLWTCEHLLLASNMLQPMSKKRTCWADTLMQGALLIQLVLNGMVLKPEALRKLTTSYNSLPASAASKTAPSLEPPKTRGSHRRHGWPSKHWIHGCRCNIIQHHARPFIKTWQLFWTLQGKNKPMPSQIT